MSLHEVSFEVVNHMPVSFAEMEIHDGTAGKQAANRSGSRRLLIALFYHHGTNANMSPPKGWKKREPIVPKPVFRAEREAPADIDPLKIEDIKRAACEYFDLTMIQLTSERRTLMNVRPRQIAMVMCKTFTGRSLPEIGRRFGNRDHTTVLHGIRRIESLCLTDWAVAYDVAHLEANLAKRFEP